MKRSFELFPPLASIERRLFGVSDGLLRAVESDEVSKKIRQAVLSSEEWRDRHSKDLDTAVTETVAAPTELPSHIADLVRRRVAVSQAKFAAVPTAGQIVEVTAIRTPRPGQLDWVMQVPLYVLLDASAESADLWHGWLVSAETDYATSWDFVLQEQDAPFDPEAGMVQVWNPVRLYMPTAGRVVAQLRAERLQAVRSLAADFLSAEELDEPPRPGRVAVRCTSEGLSVATGSPLGGNEDSRRRYLRIYHYAAEAVREPARLAIAELEPALGGVAALLKRLVDAARSAGDLLMPVPRVELAMGRKGRDVDAIRDEVAISAAETEDLKAEEQDLSWRDIARIRIVLVTPEGAGELLIIPGNRNVTAFLEDDGDKIDMVIVKPGDYPARMTWAAGAKVKLILNSEDGRKIELPLFQSP